MYKSQAEMVKEWLQAYRNNIELIDKQLDKLRTLKARMMSVGAQELSDMPRPPSAPKDRMAEYVIQAESLELLIQREMEIQDQSKKVIGELVEQLDKPEERLVIQYRYLYGMEWSEVLEKLYSREEKYLKNKDTYKRRMYRAHEDALCKMAKGWNKVGAGCKERVLSP